ncbi:MAG TPA: hypothetical protein PKW44_01835 [Methylophilaceae bacterium]|nr:hypothetical protein [Methylophilaceae bacterium]HQR60043.1 hypothetical protein [Methylophilaceae bacterium]
MAFKDFVKNNFVLIVGLALPVLLMFGFMIAGSLPNIVTDPPKYDLVFAVADVGSNNLPIALKLTVDKDGTLKAQYTPNRKEGHLYNAWKKLYIYQAKTQKVRELPFPYPADMEKIVDVKEEIVEATKELKLDTTSESPDGYNLSYDGYSHSGLVGELFMGNRYSSEPQLRKGGSAIRLVSGNARTNFYYGNIEFIGWVMDK